MGRQTVCKQGPARRKWVKLGDWWGTVKPAHPCGLQVRRASAWNGAFDFGDKETDTTEQLNNNSELIDE